MMSRKRAHCEHGLNWLKASAATVFRAPTSPISLMQVATAQWGWSSHRLVGAYFRGGVERVKANIVGTTVHLRPAAATRIDPYTADMKINRTAGAGFRNRLEQSDAAWGSR